MGGFRCSYKNCTLRSDGKTHLFHYPVFDKARCHQWLVNCKRFDYFELMVSQLKNRVVCEHHFTDNCFMNSSKFKLKHDAVPTLDGPFCETSDEPELSVEETYKQLCYSYYPVEDIENNECMTMEVKKASMNKKYREFLNIYPDLDITKRYSPPPEVSKPTPKLSEPSRHVDRDIVPITYVAPNTIDCQEDVDNNVQLVLPVSYVRKSISDNLPTKVEPVSNKPEATIKPIPTVKPLIKILAEKKISSPLKLQKVDLKPISPSAVVRLIKNNNLETTDRSMMTSVLQERVCDESNQKYVEVEDATLLNGKIDVLVDICNNVNNKAIAEVLTDSSKPAVVDDAEYVFVNNNKPNKPKLGGKHLSRGKGKSLLKMNHDKIAEIEEKRKFNMKLRDIIQERLEQLDEQDPRPRESAGGRGEERGGRGESAGERGGRAESAGDDDQDPAFLRLERRLAQMEHRLLHKIDENNDRIHKLESAVEGTLIRGSDVKRGAARRSVGLQAGAGAGAGGAGGEAGYKRYLYRELAPFLDSATRSLLYERLFVDQFAPAPAPAPASAPAPAPARSKRARRW